MTAVDLLATKVFQPADRLRTGDKSARFIDEVETLNAKSLNEIREHQLRRLRAVCAVAAETKFYRERFEDGGIANPAAVTLEEFARLRPTTRDDLRERRADLIRPPFREADLRRSATGGTTSSPVTFFMDWECLWRRRAATIAFDRWFGYDPGLKIAYLWGAPQDFPDSSSWKSRAYRSLVTRARYYPSTPLDDDRMEAYARDLEAFRPVLLQAYPTPLEVFARFLGSRGRRIPTPAVSCTAEPLLPYQSEAIERAFGVRPFNWYGSRECGRVATECARHDGLHLNAHGLYVETAEDPSLGTAGLGNILITDLWNVGAPLLRYDTRDVGRITAEPCGCGRALPRLAELTGRSGDVFVNSQGQRIPGVSFTNRVIKDSGDIEAMQIRQLDTRRFEVLIVPGKTYSESSEAWIGERISAFMQEPVETTVQIVAEIPRERSGKVRFCVNLMKGA